MGCALRGGAACPAVPLPRPWGYGMHPFGSHLYPAQQDSARQGSWGEVLPPLVGLPVPSGCLPLALSDLIIAQAACLVKYFFRGGGEFFLPSPTVRLCGTRPPDYLAYRASLGFRGANPRRLYRRRSLGWGDFPAARGSRWPLFLYRGVRRRPVLLGHDGG